MNTSHFFTDRFHLTVEGVALYVDALRLERTGQLPTEMRVHVEGCEECQRMIVESHEMIKEIPIDTSRHHPYFDRQIREPKTLNISYRIAAAVGGVALLAAGYYSINSFSSVSPSVTQQDPSEKMQPTPPRAVDPVAEPAQKQSEPLLADNFFESANLEDLVHTEFRSSSIDVVAPYNGAVVQTPVRFSWKNAEGELTLKILTNKERTLVSTKVLGNSYTAQWKFAPGLYYWKLETKKELAYVGKFLVQ